MTQKNNLILIAENESIRIKIDEILNSIYGDTTVVSSFTAEANLSQVLKDNLIVLSNDGFQIKQTIEETETLLVNQMEDEYRAKFNLDHIIGKHPIILETKIIAQKLAKTHLPILIQGESGTGKELFATAIHNTSPRANERFLTINCSSLENNTDNDLFSGQGNASSTQALIKNALGGTIFFDEVADLDLRLQAKLLQFLKELEVNEVGKSNILKDVRIIAASNKDLITMIDEGSFREDLYYRLNVLSLKLPSLRDITSDIPGLIEYFINQSGKALKVDKAVITKLCKHQWYGNVRELKNVIQYMLTVCDGHSIQLHDIPTESLKVSNQKKPKVSPDRKAKQESLSIMEKKEHYFILQTIMECNENGEPASRRIIADKSKTSTQPLTTQQIRHRLDFLEKYGYITKGRGRAGTKITSEGFDFFQSLETYII